MKNKIVCAAQYVEVMLEDLNEWWQFKYAHWFMLWAFIMMPLDLGIRLFVNPKGYFYTIGILMILAAGLKLGEDGPSKFGIAIFYFMGGMFLSLVVTVKTVEVMMFGWERLGVSIQPEISALIVGCIYYATLCYIFLVYARMKGSIAYSLGALR